MGLEDLGDKDSSDGENNGDEEEYEVERIVGHRMLQGGEIHFKVRWKGYGKDDDTYEPRENMGNCDKVIAEYWERRNKKDAAQKVQAASVKTVPDRETDDQKNKVSNTAEPESLKSYASSPDNSECSSTVADQKPETRTSSPSELKGEPVNDSKREPVVDNKPEPCNDVKKEPGSEVKPESGSDVKPEPGIDLKRESGSDIKLESNDQLKIKKDKNDLKSDPIESDGLISSINSELKKKKKKEPPSQTVKKVESSTDKALYESALKKIEKLQKENEKYRNMLNKDPKCAKSDKCIQVSVECASDCTDTDDIHKLSDQLHQESSAMDKESFVKAVKDNDLVSVKKVVMNMPSYTYDLNEKDEEEKTLLMSCASSNRAEMAKLLLSTLTVDTNIRDSKGGEGVTALMIACENGHLNVATVLLEAGAHVNKITYQGETALMKAAKNGHKETVELLLEYCADVSLKSEMQLDASLYARKNGHKEVETMIENHYSWIQSNIESRIREYFRDTYEIVGQSLFPIHCHSIKESSVLNYTLDFKTLPQTPPGGLLMLFLAHCKMEPSRNLMLTRFHGPCFVQQVKLNSNILPSPLPGANFMLGFSPKADRNQLCINLAYAPWCDTKLVVSAYAVSKISKKQQPPVATAR